MKGQVDMDKAQEQGIIAPQDIYTAELIEKKDGTSKNGDPMVAIKLAIAEGEFRGKWVWDNIIISDDPESPGYKILGRSKHFLHCIAEPYEGKAVEWDSDRWIGRVCKIRIDHEPPNEYHKMAKPIIVEYMLIDEGQQTLPQEDLPF